MARLCKLDVCRLCFSPGQIDKTDVNNRKIRPIIEFLAEGGLVINSNIPEELCANCNDMFEAAAMLRDRVRFTESLWTRYLDRINQTTTTKEGQEPLRSVVGDMLLNCHICGVFFNYDDLAKHISKEHEKDHLSGCTFCEVLFTNKPSAIEAVEAGSTEEVAMDIVKEEIAEMDFNEGETDTPSTAKSISKAAAKEKRPTRTKNVPQPPVEEEHTCNWCGESFKDISLLDKHILTHVKEKDKEPLICPTCGESFDNRESLTTHRTIKHRYDAHRPYDCPHCDRGYMRLEQLGIHLDMVHKTVDRESVLGPLRKQKARFVCVICEQAYTRVQKLDQHMLIHGKTPFHCPRCDKAFESRHEMNKHSVKCQHEIQEIPCGQCSRTFTSTRLRDLHQEELHEDKTFPCDKCDKQFASRVRLVIHQRGAHEKREKQLSCKVCNKMFVHRDNLFNHLRKKHPLWRNPEGEELEEQEETAMEINEEDGDKERVTKEDTMDTEGGEEITEDHVEESNAMNSTVLDEDPGESNSPSTSEANIRADPNEDVPSTNSDHESVAGDVDDQNTCNWCGKTFDDVASLDEHVLAHEKECFFCPTCGKSFETHHDLTIHRSTKHRFDTYRPFDCPHCDSCYLRLDELKKHLKVQHPDVDAKFVLAPFGDGKRFVCVICEAAYMRIELLDRHLLCHSETPFHCCRCDEAFDSRREMNEHNEDCTEEAQEIPCEQCSRTFTGPGIRKLHCEQVHEGAARLVQPKRKLPCKICKKELSCQKSLTQHMKTHTGNKCHECGLDFQSRKELLEHELVHGPKKPTPIPFKCTECYKKYSTKERFELHLKEHEVPRDYVCSICGDKFNHKKKLNNHKQYRHNGKVCLVCGKTIYNNFGQHMLRHQGMKPFKCQVEGCGKSFLRSTCLALHVKRHTGEKPFACDVCGMRFALSHLVNLHKRTHTGEKPYKCTFPDCSQAFAQRFDRTLHLRRHKGEKPYGCVTECGERFFVAYQLKKHQQNCEVAKNGDEESAAT